MNRLLVFLILIAAGCSGATAYSASVDVWWDPNTESDMQGYRVYLCQSNPCVKSSAVVQADVQHPKTSATFSADKDGNVAVTAYDKIGNESVFSRTLPFVVGAPDTTPPVAPNNPNVFVH